MKDKELWYRKLGFAENPFSIKPAIYNDGLYGYPHVLAEVAKTVENGKIAFVRGDYGHGKSTLLKYLLGKFGGHGRLAYFSCNRLERSLDVKRILNSRYGFFGKLFDIKPKRMILLLDEAQFLAKQDYQALMQYYDSGHLKSMVFVAKEQGIQFMPERMQRLVSIHALGEVGPDDAVSIVRKRVGRLPLLADSSIKEIFKRSGNNVRIFLKNCELLCKYAAGKGMDSITPDIVNLLPDYGSAKPHVESLSAAKKQDGAEMPAQEVAEDAGKEADEILDAAPLEEVKQETGAVSGPAPVHDTAGAAEARSKGSSSAEELYY